MEEINVKNGVPKEPTLTGGLGVTIFCHLSHGLFDPLRKHHVNFLFGIVSKLCIKFPICLFYMTRTTSAI